MQTIYFKYKLNFFERKVLKRLVKSDQINRHTNSSVLKKSHKCLMVLNQDIESQNIEKPKYIRQKHEYKDPLV